MSEESLQPHIGTSLASRAIDASSKPSTLPLLVLERLTFRLVYGGEHYVMDCLVGGVLAWLAVWGNRRLSRWWLERSTRTADLPAAHSS